ncbi:glycosyltransferase family 4 protein [Longimicrobium terrae]|uniref:Glycosyltransferase involved in cell wall biosynthesis n=1 Tax=Longimicrobium terrae TaxID=1639882 RepID=A0A841GJ53_9BACT|nr:glycosyltransferase family 4 protein [Longimicrobium terrae]MBB4634523.1 glycosyltransferase involved in cell wall biosynthesis [Longimicrobium terrae]MBB6068587.1 glycosyltransferase involved in cell wall biosynthesis [Longimicrobium terrae]NNC27774.1 glycosyltransferase family 4 protein [Longimicrobium terrae]
MTAARGDAPRRVTLLVNDLAGNALARAIPLARALSVEYEVELAGLLLSGPEVYAPYRGLFPVHAIRCSPALPAVLAAAPRLAALATGDLLYACKPLASTLLPARLAARRTGAPVLLDVEDDEWSARAVNTPAPGLRGVAQRVRDTHRFKARLFHPLTFGIAGVTVSTRALQRRHGGTLLRHGPDESRFDPDLPGLADRARLRRELGLPAEGRLAVFAGVPRPHKGWDVLLRALGNPAAAEWSLVTAGPEGAEHARARALLGGRFHSLGMLPNEAMPRLLAAADAVPIAQRDEAYARAQLPAKVLEAMAMRVPVVASMVGDLPEILGEGRGWLIAPEDDAALAAALAAIAADPAEAARRGRAARAWFVEEAGAAALRARLLPLVRGALDGGR